MAIAEQDQENWLSQGRIDTLHPQSAQTTRYRVVSPIWWGGYTFNRGQLLHLHPLAITEVGAANVELAS